MVCFQWMGRGRKNWKQRKMVFRQRRSVQSIDETDCIVFGTLVRIVEGEYVYNSRQCTKKETQLLDKSNNWTSLFRVMSSNSEKPNLYDLFF